MKCLSENSTQKVIKPKYCKVCGIEFKAFNSLQSTCSPKCERERLSNKKRNNKPVESKSQKGSLTALKNEAQRIFNKWVRLRDTDNYGKGICISSGRPLKYRTEECQAGHFYKAELYPNLAFNEDNVHLQSRTDNYYNDGNPEGYKHNLITKIGQDAYNELVRQANHYKRTGFFKPSRTYYINIINHYNEKIKELESKKI